MTHLGFRGWHGVQDHLHILIAVSYEPIDGTLACKMCSGDPICHLNVPEVEYRKLLRSKFAGSYYRKHIRGKYSVMGTPPPAYDAPVPAEKHLPKAAIPKATQPQMNLFGSRG